MTVATDHSQLVRCRHQVARWAIVLAWLLPLAVSAQGRYVPQGEAQRHFENGERRLADSAEARADGDGDAANDALREALEAFEDAVEADAAFAAAYAKIGFVRYTMGEPAGAIAPLREGLKRNPSDHELMYWLGNNQFAAGETDEGVRMLERVAAETAKFPQVYLILGNHYYKERAYERARFALEQYVKLDPENIAARGTLGNTYFKLEQYALALAEFERVRAQSPDNLVVEVNIGNSHFRLGEYERAIEILGRVFEKDPNRLSVLFNLAQSWFQLGRYEEAVRYYDRFVDRQPKSFNGRYFRGSALMELGIDDRALADLEVAASLQPKIAQPKYKIGLIHLRAGRDAPAEAAFEAARAVAPDNPWPLTALGTVARRKGELGRALELQTRALERGEDEARLHGNLAATHLAAGKLDAATERWLRARALDGADAWIRDVGVVLFATRARAKLEAGDPTAAEVELLEAQRLQPDAPALRRNLIVVYVELGRAADALELARALIAEAPDDAANQYAMGRALLAANQPTEALVPLQAAHAARPDEVTAAAVGAAALLSGDADLALDALEAVVESGTSDPAVQTNLALAHVARAGTLVKRSRGDNPRARRHLERALASEPLLGPVDAGRGRYAALVLALRRGDGNEARQHLARLARLVPRARDAADDRRIWALDAPANHIDYLTAIADALQKRPSRVVSRFEGTKAIRERRSDEAKLLRWAYMQLADAAFAGDDLEAAARALKSARGIARDDVAEHNEAVIDFRQGRAKKAEKRWRALVGKMPEVGFNLGLALEARGAHDEAYRQFAEYGRGKGPGAERAREIAEIKRRVFGLE